MLARGAVAYAVAGALTAVVAFLATIPCTDFVTIAGMTADAAALVGWPTLLAADAITRHRGGAA
jgi:hypothetical protein